VSAPVFNLMHLCRILGGWASPAGDANGAVCHSGADGHKRNTRACRVCARRILGQSHGHCSAACRRGYGDLQYSRHYSRWASRCMFADFPINFWPGGWCAFPGSNILLQLWNSSPESFLSLSGCSSCVPAAMEGSCVNVCECCQHVLTNNDAVRET